MAVKITDLGQAVLPLVGTEVLEIVQDDVSRQVSADDLGAASGLGASYVTVTANANLPNERILTAGVNIGIVDGGAGNPVTINLDAALVGVSVNGVTLDDGGAATNYLDETGAYSVPAGGGGGSPFSTPLVILADINTATPPGSEAVTGFLEIRDLQDVNSLAEFGYTNATNQLFIRNKMRNGDVRIVRTDSGGTERVILDAGSSTILISPGNLSLNVGNTEVALLAIDNGFVGLYFNNVRKIETKSTGLRLFGSLFVQEQAAADADVAGDGQFWVRSDAPNVPMFTDDVGTDFELGVDFDPAADQVISGSWEFTNILGLELGPSCELRIRNNADDSTMFIQNIGPTLQFGIAGGDFGDGVFQIGQTSFARVECPVIFIGEQAAAESDIVAKGQLWVRDDTPNILMFTDDAGTDFTVDVTAV